MRENSIRVFHVDDDSNFLVALKRIIELSESFHVEPVLSVKEAINKLNEQKFDVIVSDYQIPIRNGSEFLKERRNKDPNEHLGNFLADIKPHPILKPKSSIMLTEL